MNPLKIEVEVKLSEATLEAIKRIALAAIFKKLTPEAQEELERNTFKDEEPAKEPEAKPAEAPVEEDMPEEIMEPAPAPVQEISDDELAAKTRETVAALKKAGKPTATIRNVVFAKYGIAQSTACPKDKRAELMADLDNLVNA